MNPVALLLTVMGIPLLMRQGNEYVRGPNAPISHPQPPFRPITVGCYGLPRTGSTVVYNLVRLLLGDVDPQLLEGWVEDTIGNQDIRTMVEGLHGQQSIVYKAHVVTPEMRDATDVFIFSHRSPYDAVCSYGLMFQPDVMDDDSKAVKHCRGMQCLQKSLYQAAEGKPTLDISYDTMLTDEGIINTLDQLIDLLKLGGMGIDRQRLVWKLRKLVPPAAGMFEPHHPKTLLHTEHVHTAEDRRRCAVVSSYLDNDPSCVAWNQMGGAAGVVDVSC